jgi:hypothetical protein
LIALQEITGGAYGRLEGNLGVVPMADLRQVLVTVRVRVHARECVCALAWVAHAAGGNVFCKSPLPRAAAALERAGPQAALYLPWALLQSGETSAATDTFKAYKVGCRGVACAYVSPSYGDLGDFGLTFPSRRSHQAVSASAATTGLRGQALLSCAHTRSPGCSPPSCSLSPLPSYEGV